MDPIDAFVPPPSTSRSNRRISLVLGAVVMIVLLVMAVIWLQGREEHGDGQGPLGSCGTPCGWADKVAQVPGVTSWTFGVALCLEPGAGVAVLDSVAPITTVGNGFTLVGTGVRQFTETPSHTSIISVDGWPPPADQVPDVVSSVQRYAISTPPCSPTGSPSTEPYTELLVGLGLVSGDGGGWQGLAIGYTAGGRHRVLDLDVGLLICGTSVDCGGPSPTTAPATTPSTAALASAIVAADTATADALVERYETALTTGDSATAWALLAPWSQAMFPSYGAFAAASARVGAQDGHGFVVGAPRTDDPYIAVLLAKGDPGIADAIRVYSVSVTHPDATPSAAHTDVLYVALDQAGAWKTWRIG